MRITLRTLVMGGLGVFVAVQLIPVWLYQTNPPVKSTPAWDSPQTEGLARRACFDCHSNETKWTVASRIAPGSWLATWHVVRGRDELNFSDLAAKAEQGEAGEAGEQGEAGERGKEIAEQINEGEMPPPSYLLLHPEARLTDAEKQQLIQGLQATLK